MIAQPHLGYLLELWAGLGPASQHFVLAGAQAMKFMDPRARATRDFDFALDAVALGRLDFSVASTLQGLGYQPVPEARNFQFQKSIPGTAEVMRIEFLGPESAARRDDIRADVQPGVHARACAGAEVALAESEVREINGRLPSGKHARAQIRVIRPWALVMLKCLALEDRYRNLRGARHVEHDRNEARIHAGDIVSILSVQAGLEEFGARFLKQLEVSPDLKKRVLSVVTEFFGGQTKPGFLLYEELLTMGSSPEVGEEVQRALDRAERLLARLVDLCNRELSLCWPEERPR